MKVKVQSENMSATIMYNMKSDNQARYAQNVFGQKSNCHIRYSPLHQISMGLLLIHFDRNNVIVDILNTLNYGLAIPSLQCLNPFSTNVPLMDKPGSWFLLAKCLENTCGSDILNKDAGHRSFRGTTKKCESKNLNIFFF